MAHSLAPQTEADLDEIWLCIARLIESIVDRFFALANFPYLGRSRDEEFGPGSRSLACGEYVIVYDVHGQDVFILRVVHGKRDLNKLFGS